MGTDKDHLREKKKKKILFTFKFWGTVHWGATHKTARMQGWPDLEEPIAGRSPAGSGKPSVSKQRLQGSCMSTQVYTFRPDCWFMLYQVCLGFETKVLKLGFDNMFLFNA